MLARATAWSGDSAMRERTEAVRFFEFLKDMPPLLNADVPKRVYFSERSAFIFMDHEFFGIVPVLDRVSAPSLVYFEYNENEVVDAEENIDYNGMLNKIPSTHNFSLYLDEAIQFIESHYATQAKRKRAYMQFEFENGKIRLYCGALKKRSQIPSFDEVFDSEITEPWEDGVKINMEVFYTFIKMAYAEYVRINVSVTEDGVFLTSPYEKKSFAIWRAHIQ